MRHGLDPEQPPAMWGRAGVTGLLGWERPPVNRQFPHQLLMRQLWMSLGRGPVPPAAASLASVPDAQSRKEGGESAVERCRRQGAGRGAAACRRQIARRGAVLQERKAGSGAQRAAGGSKSEARCERRPVWHQDCGREHTQRRRGPRGEI
jgi:hypothetical protein